MAFYLEMYPQSLSPMCLRPLTLYLRIYLSGRIAELTMLARHSENKVDFILLLLIHIANYFPIYISPFFAIKCNDMTCKQSALLCSSVRTWFPGSSRLRPGSPVLSGSGRANSLKGNQPADGPWVYGLNDPFTGGPGYHNTAHSLLLCFTMTICLYSYTFQHSSDYCLNVCISVCVCVCACSCECVHLWENLCI
jgi:hypothetical protein